MHITLVRRPAAIVSAARRVVARLRPRACGATVLAAGIAVVTAACSGSEPFAPTSPTLLGGGSAQEEAAPGTGAPNQDVPPPPAQDPPEPQEPEPQEEAVTLAEKGLRIDPDRVPGHGGPTSTVGTVTLTGPAPAGGTVVTLHSSRPDKALVPGSLTIPAGGTSGTFVISTRDVKAEETAVITVALGPCGAPPAADMCQSRMLRLLPPPPDALPPTLTGIGPDAAAAPGEMWVTLTGTNFVWHGTEVSMSGTGVLIREVEVVLSGGEFQKQRATSIRFRLNISASAPPGARTVTVKTSAGTASGTFTIM